MTNETNVDVRHETSSPSAPPREWEPLAYVMQQFDRLRRDIDWPDFRLPFHRGQRGVEASAAWPTFGMGVPAVDLIERPDRFEVQAELPGFDPAAIEVRISDNTMSIRAERSSEHEEDVGGYHLRERSRGNYQRLFRLPGGIATDKVEARYDKGVLSITLPKTAESMEKERRIEVKAA
ncbi:Hsp20/alpha crystallin family protein [Cereibacter sphaeroides]|uniref:Hsp20/alpha crystallin family protein n=1 Tax=Rhodobacterales TaxID=204455 RepID=UPI000BBF30D6|nr:MULTISPECIES: Hsp20/alpha crystallin family protein [Paracoccaceae]MCE6951328.1 Hsp20/alpha crystallin family protein [Cereibacter sphaeroides]MCE6960653.1 Hsp20/alpha crystallin family protein [Cereibacter sphaeroides]MCE6970080.1 Hsp20/alpha crystallin family protein [Cereibacter sphaeroides]MCE6973245.1 Hsp20/alpha crystallin family protein [Cereibacter sphaeroides]